MYHLYKEYIYTHVYLESVAILAQIVCSLLDDGLRRVVELGFESVRAWEVRGAFGCQRLLRFSGHGCELILKVVDVFFRCREVDNYNRNYLMNRYTYHEYLDI